jgi:hypothetical protein
MSEQVSNYDTSVFYPGMHEIFSNLQAALSFHIRNITIVFPHISGTCGLAILTIFLQK